VIFDRKNLNQELTIGEIPGTMYGLSLGSGWIDTELLKTVKAQVSQKQVHMMQLFSSHCYAALHLFKEMKLQIRNLTSL